LSCAAEKIELGREVYRQDLEKMADWLADDRVVRFLNEEQNIADRLKQSCSPPSSPHLFFPVQSRRQLLPDHPP
jgi:hypothetical protein